jgi:hypothetical protein
LLLFVVGVGFSLQPGGVVGWHCASDQLAVVCGHFLLMGRDVDEVHVRMHDLSQRGWIRIDVWFH